MFILTLTEYNVTCLQVPVYVDEGIANFSAMDVEGVNFTWNFLLVIKPLVNMSVT